MPKWLGVPAFTSKLAKYEQVTYKQILGYADAGILPTLPRFGHERVRIKFCRELIEFLIDRSLTEHEIKDILTGWDGE